MCNICNEKPKKICTVDKQLIIDINIQLDANMQTESYYAKCLFKYANKLHIKK